MSRRNKNAGHVNHERWMVSYADFITLMFAVFVVLYAASQTDQRKIGRLSLAIQVAFQDLGLFQASTTSPALDDQAPMPFQDAQMIENIDRNLSVGTIVPSIAPAAGMNKRQIVTDDLKDKMSQALAPEIKKKQVELRGGPDGLILTLHEMGFYALGSDVLTESSRSTLDKVAGLLQPTQLNVRIEGHTDNVPIHNARFDSNWELSAARATGLVRVFIERYRFQPSRLSSAGYGEYHPVAPNDTEEGRASNRRVDLVILSPVRAPAPKTQIGNVLPTLPSAPKFVYTGKP